MAELRKARKSNFSKEEVHALVATVRKHYKVLYGKYAKKASNKSARCKAWLDVLHTVNKVSLEKRTMPEIKNKWKKCVYMLRDPDAEYVGNVCLTSDVWVYFFPFGWRSVFYGCPGFGFVPWTVRAGSLNCTWIGPRLGKFLSSRSRMSVWLAIVENYKQFSYLLCVFNNVFLSRIAGFFCISIKVKSKVKKARIPYFEFLEISCIYIYIKMSQKIEFNY